MADISKIKTLDGTTYDLKDTIARRVHDPEPLETKTYTNIIATANDNNGAGFFYLKIRANDFTNSYWHVKTRVKASVPGNVNYYTDTTFDLWGLQNTYSWYACVNRIRSTSYRPIYYNSYFRVSSTGYNNGCGAWAGFNLWYSANPTTATLKREITVELLAYENCTVELQDELITPTNIPNRAAHTDWYSSTNTSFDNFDAASPGLKQSGDANTTSISNLYLYNGHYRADSILYRYELLFQTDEDTLTPLNNASNGNGSTTKTMLTNVEFDPFGRIYYYNSTTTVNPETNIGAGALFWSHSGLDLRYTFNCGTTLTAHKPFYLIVIPTGDSKCKIANDSPWAQDLPTTNDGKWYILLGRTYSTYQMALHSEHPVFRHNGTSIQRVVPPSDATTVNGHTINSDVPADAKFTDTTYESKAAASGGTALSLVTTGEKYTWNNKGSYSKPSSGIPKTDLASAVQTSLEKADSALQSHQTIKQDGVTGATVNRFGTCSTAAGTAAKTVNITTGTFTLEAGARVTVKFTNANTANTPTLNVNSKGAKNIFHKGAQITSGGNKALLAGTVDFVYDGTQWHLIGNYIDTTNIGTITGITMNGASKGTSGVVDLGTVITAHQDISGKLNSSLKGAANGLAELDANGKVPSSQLPSYVDDVLEYNGQSAFPTTGETGKIYVDAATNKTYRWGGSSYVEISSSLALGETSSTAYRGDRGKIAYDHSQSTHARTDATAVAASSTNGNIKINGTETTVYTHPGSGTNPHGTTKSDIGLSNVGNFKAVSTVASQGLTDTEKSNARTNIGAGTSSLTLGTSSNTAYRGDYGNKAYTHAVTNKGSAFTSGLYKITTNSEGHVTSATAVTKTDITALGIPGSDTNTTYTANTSKLVTTTVPNITSAGSTPTLGTAIPADDITEWTTNVPTSFAIEGEKLKITVGSAAILKYTAKSIPNVTSVGSAPTLGTAITVATGALASNGSGGTVATGITAS